MLLNVNPVRKLSGQATIPSSKPETQRAILAAVLAKGTSIIHNDLRCLETTTMKNACRHFGANITEKEGYLEIKGIGRDLIPDKKVIDALGSGLVFRVFTAISSFSKKPTIITGDNILRTRVMSPLFNALRELGAKINCIAEDEKAPIVNWGGGFHGGKCFIPGNISSQFITSILFAAPMAENPTEICVQGEILSISYIKQTIDTMIKAGLKVEVSDNYSRIKVYPGEYQATEYKIVGDFTSSSYLIVASAIYPGRTTLSNMNSNSLQGEKYIINIIRELGIYAVFDDDKNQLVIESHEFPVGNYEFDASDYPNIIPTLAALGSYVNGCFRVIGGSITRLHKSPRIEAIITELKKMGVDIKPIFKNHIYDGFEINGKSHYSGGVTLSSWGDHRIFMSLFVASLRCNTTNKLEGYDEVHCSFPDFFKEFHGLGASFCETIDENDSEEENKKVAN